MAINFTSEQRAAIDSRNNRLIVSAAAGSGKTAVLVQRVIELICDPNTDCSVDRLVVVTFTKAAASEMRSRIGEALQERLREDPENTRLRRQLALLPDARIQTVDSFCQDLIRRNFTKCGVTADFRVMDQDESVRLRAEVLEEILEEQYEQGLPAFVKLCDATRENRGDARLVSCISRVYDKIMSMPEPERWLENAVQQFVCDSPEETGWGKYTLKLVRGQLQRVYGDMARAEELLQTELENIEVWRKDFAAIKAQLPPREIWEDWDRLRKQLGAFNWGRAPGKKFDPDMKQQLTMLRKDMKNRIARIREDLLVADRNEITREQALQSELVEELCRLVIMLIQRFRQEKRQRNQLDFSDIEHLTYQILTGPEGGPSDLALELSAQISELLVDEYQDTNELQDAIFTRLCPKKGGMFLVGDLKQSIYRFRMAEPGIFLERYKNSVPLEKGMQGKDVRLALNRNYRSAAQVLDLCNFVFERTMTEAFGGIDYDENERLYVGENAGVPEAPCEAWILEMPPREESKENSNVIEARFVAARISQMLQDTVVLEKNGGRRPAVPSDFAILLSSFSNREPYYSAELQKLHIPVSAASRGDFWNSPEILTIMSFLRVIDNRRQDIPLIGLMRSPVYLFTAEELARIRLYRRKLDYADVLEMAAPDMPKAAQLLADLDRYGDLACDMTVSELLRLIYEEKNLTGLFAALENGERRRDNLEQFMNLACSFERNGARGLYRFIQYADDQMENDRQPEFTGGQNGVRIMSIHKSKGLEFPIVFMPDLEKQFNEREFSDPVQIHKENGIAMKLRFPELHAEITPQMFASTARRSRADSRAEEMRKLYVGMTRARQQLILSAAVKNPGKMLKSLAAEFGMGEYDPLPISECSKVSDWVFGTLLQHPSASAFREVSGEQVRVIPGLTEGLRCRILGYLDDMPAYDYAETLVKQHTAEELEDPDELLAMIDRSYPYGEISKLPSKLTPTGVKRLMPETAELYAGSSGNAVRLYHAATDQKSSAADRGSANHLALSCLSLEHCRTMEGVSAELKKAAAEKRIPEAVLKLVDPKLVLKFMAGPLGDRTMAADRYLREYEFGVLLPPEGLLGGPETGEKILVNGVIDLLLFEKDSMTVIDFKTDNVKPGMAQEAAQKHKLQLEIYAQAAGEVFDLPVKERIVFFLRTGEWALV